MSDLVDAFMRDHVAAKRKPKTEKEYQIIVDRHIKPVLGSMRASAVVPADVARLQSHITRGKSKLENGGRTMANCTLAVLSAAFNWAQGMGLVPDGLNPTKRVERFKENQKERFLTSAELNAFGDALIEAETIGLQYEIDEKKPKAKHAAKLENRRTVYGPHLVAAFRLLLLTGARKSEILNLRWNEIDLERGVLFLPDSKTGRKTVVLSAAALSILSDLPRIGMFVIAGDFSGNG